ncbi:MAG: hypothetical protein Q7S16_02045 [bacterium]|nr:hypothetical protein [bacterium]
MYQYMMMDGVQKDHRLKNIIDFIMHRHSTFENPFAPHRDRSPDDPALVGKILGPEAEAAMRKGTEPQKAQEPGPTTDFEFTNEERAKIAAEKEAREAPERARRDLIAWAKSNNQDEEWVKKTFTIHPDGTLTVEKDLHCLDLPGDPLPKRLTKVGGTLSLRGSNITSLEGLPQEIGEDLILRRINITSLEGLPQKIGHSLNLRETPITSLKGLPLEIDGDLDLGGTKITSLEGLPQKIGGYLSLRFTNITSLQGLPQEIHGELNISRTFITSLEGLPREIHGDLELCSTRITSLDGLPKKIGGSLILSDTRITSLKGLPKEIHGTLDISATRITSLDDLPQKIDGSLYLLYLSVKKIPSGLDIGGEVVLEKGQTELIEEAHSKGYTVRIYDEK